MEINKYWGYRHVNGGYSVFIYEGDGSKIEKAFEDEYIDEVVNVFSAYDYQNAMRFIIKEIATRTGATMSEFSNSEIGSYHWFSTLAAFILHMGEYLKDKGSPHPDVLQSWGQGLFDRQQEIIKWFKTTRPDSNAK